MKKVLIVIPARFHSTRFPGKLLFAIHGKPILQYVYENAVNTEGVEVVVATDHEAIVGLIQKLEGEVIMTSPQHKNGTERLLEVADKKPGYDLYLNLQGDEPMVDDNFLGKFISFCKENPSHIWSAMRKIDMEKAQSHNVVKVVTNHNHQAMYFSRSLIPYPREEPAYFSQHIGIYAFSPTALQRLQLLKPSRLEEVESLEQLRWLENELGIAMYETEREFHGVDVKEDVEFILRNGLI